MKSKIFILLALLAQLPVSSANTLEQWLARMTSASQEKCSIQKNTLDTSMKAAGSEADKKKKNEMFLLRQQMKMMCECLPAEFDKVKAAKKPEELNAEISQDAFFSIYRHVSGTCVAQQQKNMFSAFDCAQHFTKESQANPNFCGCMSQELSKLSNDDMFDMVTSVNKDFELKVKAQKSGLPDPVKSEWGKRNDEMNQRCLVPAKAAKP